MADKKIKEEETKEALIIKKITSFASAYRKWIFIGLAAIVVALVAVVIISSSVNKKNEKTFIRVANYEDKLEAIIASEDSSEVNAYIADVEKEINGSKYPSVKAAYILGEYYSAKEDWAKAYDYFMKSYNLNSKIYLSSVAQFNAAVASEEKGDANTALSLYQNVSSDFENPLASKALFNVARIYMQMNNKELAKVTFQQLIDNFEYSEYALLAKNIIALM